MKRIIAALLLAALALTLSGCEKNAIIIDPLEDELAGTSDYYGTVEVSADKTAYNYLTGNDDMAADLVGRRPYAVSVNNILDCWPQYGLSQADIIYEIETEGGITRMMALFMDIRGVPLIGSIRSLRDQFLEAVYPLDPIIVHYGTSVYVDKTLAHNNLRTLDAKQLASAVYVDRERMAAYAIEHCKFTSAQLISETLPAAKIKETLNTRVEHAFNFASEDEEVSPSLGAASELAFSFSSYGGGDFRYDEPSQKYLKWQYGKPQLDAGNDDRQLAFDNVFVLFAAISQLDGTELVSVDYAAGGEGVYLSRGRYEKFTWAKSALENNFVFTDENGNELEVNRGNSYLAVVRDTRADKLRIDGETI